MRAALITLKDGRKLGFISQHLIPKLAICDESRSAFLVGTGLGYQVSVFAFDRAKPFRRNRRVGGARGPGPATLPKLPAE